MIRSQYAEMILDKTRKYPLRGYILGVLPHTTALDRLWGGDETLTKWFKNRVYAPRLRLSSSALGSEGDPGCIFFTLTTYQTTFIGDIL